MIETWPHIRTSIYIQTRTREGTRHFAARRTARVLLPSEQERMCTRPQTMTIITRRRKRARAGTRIRVPACWTAASLYKWSRPCPSRSCAITLGMHISEDGGKPFTIVRKPILCTFSLFTLFQLLRKLIPIGGNDNETDQNKDAACDSCNEGHHCHWELPRTPSLFRFREVHH